VDKTLEAKLIRLGAIITQRVIVSSLNSPSSIHRPPPDCEHIYREPRRIDDLLLTDPTDSERRHLLQIVEDRYQAGATAITSQCPITDWHPDIGDPTLADAIL
jgi:hypothetical protein